MNLLSNNRLEKDEMDLKKVLESLRGLIRDEENRKQQLIYQLPYYKNFEHLFRKLYLLYEKFDGRLDNGKNEIFQHKKALLLSDITKIHYAYKDWLLTKVNQIN